MTNAGEVCASEWIHAGPGHCGLSEGQLSLCSSQLTRGSTKGQPSEQEPSLPWLWHTEQATCSRSQLPHLSKRKLILACLSVLPEGLNRKDSSAL